MSQHYFNTLLNQDSDLPVLLLMGWDRMTQMLFCELTKTTGEKNITIYDHLDEEKPQNCSLEHFTDLLYKRYQIVVPEKMVHEIKKDKAFNVGNRTESYNKEDTHEQSNDSI